MKLITDLFFSSLAVVLIACVLLICDLCFAAPEFCSVDYFKNHELVTHAPKTKRLHSFQIGQLTLSGLAVGSSDVAEVASLSPSRASDKHCTWYLNQGNRGAERAFNHVYLPGPYMAWLPFISSRSIADTYETKLNPELPKILSCVERDHYLASGCDGERHRGPSEFAWFLSLAGCDSKTSTEIANHFWALNGVPLKTRQMIAERGYQVGSKFPEYRKRLQEVMK